VKEKTVAVVTITVDCKFDRGTIDDAIEASLVRMISNWRQCCGLQPLGEGVRKSDAAGIYRAAAEDARRGELCPVGDWRPSLVKPSICGLTAVHSSDHRLGVWK
jgi:hypothetical protein